MFPTVSFLRIIYTPPVYSLIYLFTYGFSYAIHHSPAVGPDPDQPLGLRPESRSCGVGGWYSLELVPFRGWTRRLRSIRVFFGLRVLAVGEVGVSPLRPEWTYVPVILCPCVESRCSPLYPRNTPKLPYPLRSRPYLPSSFPRPLFPLVTSPLSLSRSL